MIEEMVFSGGDSAMVIENSELCLSTAELACGVNLDF
jgi:hypothetical protein